MGPRSLPPAPPPPADPWPGGLVSLNPKWLPGAPVTRGERASSPRFPGGRTSPGLDSPHAPSPLPSWPLPIGTGKMMLASSRPRDLAKRVNLSFSSGGSSLVLPVARRRARVQRYSLSIVEWVKEPQTPSSREGGGEGLRKSSLPGLQGLGAEITREGPWGIGGERGEGRGPSLPGMAQERAPGVGGGGGEDPP